MPPPIKFPVRIAPEYVRELRARVEALGPTAVARAAGLTRGTVWRQVTGADGRKPVPSTIEAIRRAVAKIDPQGEPLPPAVVAVRGRVHHAWIAAADEIAPEDLERAIADALRRHGRR